MKRQINVSFMIILTAITFAKASTLPPPACNTERDENPTVNGVNTCPSTCPVISQSLITYKYKCLPPETVSKDITVTLICPSSAPYQKNMVNSDATTAQECLAMPLCGIGYLINPQPTANGENACPVTCNAIATNKARGLYFCVTPNSKYLNTGFTPTNCPTNAPHLVLPDSTNDFNWQCANIMSCGITYTSNPQPVPNGPNACPAECPNIATGIGLYFCSKPNTDYLYSGNRAPTACASGKPPLYDDVGGQKWKCP